MMRGLLSKELQQHRMLFMFLFVILAGGLLLIGGNSLIQRAGGSGFFGVRLLLLSFLPLECLFLCHALVATEFRQKTQLFLEGLPLPRWRMLFVKFALGFGVLLASMVAAIVIAWWTTRNTEAMTPRFAALLLLKSAGWTWFLFSLFFAHAFLGRYRVPFAVLVLLGFVYLQQVGVEISSFGPFQLIDDRFPFERHEFPARALWITFGTGLFLTLLGFQLGLVRDATVASLLAEKMSSREKIFTTFLLLSAVMALGYLDDKLTKSTPVNLPGASEALTGTVRVFASAAVDAPSREETALLQRNADDVAKEIVKVAEYLNCQSPPAVFIVHRRDLKANEFQNGSLKTEQGLMVRVNLSAADFKPQELRAWILREFLVTLTHGLAKRERNAWVLDGFLEWWPHRASTHSPSAEWTRINDIARTSMPPNFSTDHLRRWYTVRKDLGEANARALAASGIAVLERNYGDEACRKFLGQSLERRLSPDVRSWFRDVTNPVSARMRKATNVPLETFANEWRESLVKPVTQISAQP